MEKENELDVDLEDLDQIDANSDRKLQVKNRYQQLANDKRELSQKLEAEAKAKAEAETKRLEAEKKLEFYKGFNTISSKYPEAANYQEQILDRHSKGIDLEEATLGILAKEGKLQATKTEEVHPEGGSAINPEVVKDPSNLTVGESLQTLKDLEKTGDLQKALRGGINVG